MEKVSFSDSLSSKTIYMRQDNICYQVSVQTQRRSHVPGTLFVLKSCNGWSDFCCPSFVQPL